jgi:alpha-tubulin suppressor-like RCC1 family protein
LGQVKAWGKNYNKRLIVPKNGEYIAISAGGYHSLAVTADGHLVAWGTNHYNQSNASKEIKYNIQPQHRPRRCVGIRCLPF